MTDREIDALVAEKVMGNDVFSIGGPNPLQEGNKDQGTRILAHYSTSIEAAWEVVEKLRSIAPERYDYNFEIQQLSDEYWVNIELDFHGEICGVDEIYEAENKSAPKAICLAALKAVGVNIDG